MLRVRGRLENAHRPIEERITLPAKHHFTALLIGDTQRRVLDPGLRQKVRSGSSGDGRQQTSAVSCCLLAHITRLYAYVQVFEDPDRCVPASAMHQLAAVVLNISYAPPNESNFNKRGNATDEYFHLNRLNSSRGCLSAPRVARKLSPRRLTQLTWLSKYRSNCPITNPTEYTHNVYQL